MILRRIYDGPDWDFRNPLEEMQRMKRCMEALLENFASAPWREGTAGVFPLINVTEDKDKFFVRAELPGVKAEQVEISVTANSLSITGERNIPVEDAKARYHRREREAGQFSRVITLPAAIDSDKVEARSADGVLTITLPKAESAKPKQISIRAS